MNNASRRRSPMCFAFFALVLALSLSACRPSSGPAAAPADEWLPVETLAVVPEAIPVRCELAARHSAQIAAQIPGAAVLEWMAPEGARVAAGDPVARFDAASWERDALKLSNAWFRASRERASLEEAELPLERLDLESAAAAEESSAADEAAFLDTARDLRERGWMGDAELARQEAAAAAARTRADVAALRLSLTADHLHPARLDKARAAETLAEAQYREAAAHAAACTLRAETAGIVGHLPLAIGGEWRTAQVGDTLYRNQAFLRIDDPSGLVLVGEVPEGDLPAVRESAPAVGIPVAWPGVRIEATVESVGRIARATSGNAPWRRVFPLVFAVSSPLPDDLPLGITVETWVQPPAAPPGPAIPLRALRWRDGSPGVLVRPADPAAEPEWRPVAIGPANATHVAILDGLAPGDLVKGTP